MTQFSHHSFRRSMATTLHGSGASLNQIKMAGGWRSTAVVEGYVETSIGEKRKSAQMLSVTSQNNEQPLKLQVLSKAQEVAVAEKDSPESYTDMFKRGGIVFSNCSNCSITFN